MLPVQDVNVLLLDKEKRMIHEPVKQNLTIDYKRPLPAQSHPYNSQETSGAANAYVVTHFLVAKKLQRAHARLQSAIVTELPKSPNFAWSDAVPQRGKYDDMERTYPTLKPFCCSPPKCVGHS